MEDAIEAIECREVRLLNCGAGERLELAVERSRARGNSCWRGDDPRVGTSLPDEERVELDREDGGGEDDPPTSGGEDDDLDEDGSLLPIGRLVASSTGRIRGEPPSDEEGVDAWSGVCTPPPGPLCLGSSSVSNESRRAGEMLSISSGGWP